MSERYAIEVPSEEELDEGYRGIPFAAFKNLDDEEVERLWGERKAGNEDTTESFFEDIILRKYTKWRKNGLPDRNVTYEEALGHLKELVDIYKAKDPDFGQLAHEQYEAMLQNEQELVHMLFQYLYDQFEPWQNPVVSDYTLLWAKFEQEDIDNLIRTKVLEHRRKIEVHGNVYGLSKPYYEHWLVQTSTGEATLP